jgi:hypothetical protein
VAGLPLPSCGWCISPWVDLENTAPPWTKAAVDPLIQKPYLMELAKAISVLPPRTPLASPLFADLKGLPPITSQVGWLKHCSTIPCACRRARQRRCHCARGVARRPMRSRCSTAARSGRRAIVRAGGTSGSCRRVTT